MYKQFQEHTDKNQYFYLSGRLSKEEQYYILRDQLEQYPNLKDIELKLYGSEFNEKYCIPIGQILSDHKLLTKLYINFNSNGLSTIGIVSIMNGLQLLKDIKCIYLKLQSKSSKSNSDVHIYQGIKNFHNLIDLTLIIDQVGTPFLDNLESLIENLKSKTNLVNLQIANQYLSECIQNCSSKWISILSNFPKLLRVHIPCNLPCKSTANDSIEETIVSTLKQCVYIKEVRLSSNMCCNSWKIQCLLDCLEMCKIIMDQLYLQNQYLHQQSLVLDNEIKDKYKDLNEKNKFIFKIYKNYFIDLHMEANLIEKIKQRNLTYLNIKVLYQCLFPSIDKQLQLFLNHYKHLNYLTINSQKKFMFDKRSKRMFIRKNIRLVILQLYI